MEIVGIVLLVIAIVAALTHTVDPSNIDDEGIARSEGNEALRRIAERNSPKESA